MNYESTARFLRDIRNNIYQMNNQQRLQMMLIAISEHPDSLSLIRNLDIIDPDLLNQLIMNGANGYAVAQSMLNQIEIKTPNSDDLSMAVFGYVKTITPAELDDYIDEVYGRIESQQIYSKDLEEARYQEQEIALDELEEFL